MSLYLTADDLHRYEQSSRAMLAPLAAPTVDQWRRSINEAVRNLVGGDKVISFFPNAERLLYCEEDPDLAASVEDFVTAYSSDGLLLSDPVVQFAEQLRRKEAVEIISWAFDAQMIGRYGYRMIDSAMVNDVLAAHGVRDFVGLYPMTNLGDILVWVLFEQTDRMRFGEATLDLLRTLLPSLKAGLDALVRFGAQRQSLDQLAEAVIVFGSDQRELHRNAAFVRLCEADPEHAIIVADVRRLAASLHPLVYAGRTPTHAPGSRTATTRTASYDLKGTLLPAGSFGSEPSVMVTVSSNSVVLPGEDVLRERFGFTRREAEVALLLAEGCSNADIAERLFVSPHTARRHTANIYEKLGVNTRKGLALLFLQP